MELTDLSWSQVDQLPRNMPVLIPIAALEQHGHHMPVFTDSLLLGEVVRRVKEPLKDSVLFAPLMWLGNSEHHLDFAGTMTASPRLYLDLLRDLAENFLFHGFQRLIFLNGHGGNIIPSQQVVFELRQKYRERNDLLLLASTYWTLGGQPHEVNQDIKQTHMGHACEWETSMMLRIRPELVQNLDQTQPVEFGNPFQPASRGWITKDRSPTGHIGDPRHATAEKGETIFTVFAADVVNLLERVIAWDGVSWSG
ncbi:MAG: creatininase family protein [Planctomycetaceae bacterium]|nr:creatininase family protein [Planctomycetaceae bacterium]